jgi:hypothetical protein
LSGKGVPASASAESILDAVPGASALERKADCRDPVARLDSLRETPHWQCFVTGRDMTTEPLWVAEVSDNQDTMAKASPSTISSRQKQAVLID